MKIHNLVPNFCRVLGLISAFGLLSARAQLVLYNDTFQAYAAQNPAPSPLVNGPTNGTWYFVDPTPPTIAANEHRIFDSGGTGSALQSRVWISSINNCRITNAIGIPMLPANTNLYTFTFSFLVATDTTDATRASTFLYSVGASAGELQFVSGGNADASQAFLGLSSYGVAPTGAKGKTSDRKFNVVFTATNFTTADKIFVSLTRVTNAGTSGAFIAVDDVSLAVNFGPPLFLQQPASQSVTAGDVVVFTGIATNFPNAYQWYKDGQPIAGATSPSYTIPFVTKPNEGSYVLWATNSEGFAESSPAVLTVSDSTAPVLASAAGVLTLQHALIRFSEPVQDESATNAANYSLSGSVSVYGARKSDPFSVELLTSALNPGAPYTVTVSGVQDTAGLTIAPGSTAGFTSPALVVSAARYDAGTTVTRPGGPPDPASPDGGYWILTTNLNVGMDAGPLTDDAGTGLNAWRVGDQNILSTGNILDYRMAIDSASDNLARSNGWRLVVVSRMVSDFSGSASPVFLYSHPGIPRRYGVQFDINADGNLTASVLGNSTYVLPGDPYGYHTNVIIWNPATSNASYYLDGQIIVANYAGDAGATYNGLAFGTGSSTGSGEMNFNRVQLDAVGATQPVVTTNPGSTVNGVGQKVTFIAGFSPFVAAYQWLSNNVVIGGAVSNAYTTDFITLDMSGASYVCRALHALGNVETAPAVLTVTSDTNPPVATSASGSLLLDRVTITYSEPVLPLYATNLANYVWPAGGVTNLASRMVDPLTVEVRTTAQQGGSNYTVRISNVRDTSNLVIATNSPAAFKTAKMLTLARYDAGTTLTQPSGPPDPVSPAGGNWAFVIGNDPLLTTNAILDDAASGYHAWQVSDATSAAGQFIQYNMPFTPEQNALFRQNGWTLSVRGRFVEDFTSSFTVIAQYGDQAGNRQLLWFDRDANGDLVVRLQGGPDRVVTAGGTGVSDYHLHQIAFNPGTTNASYYCDGEMIATWNGDVSAFTYAGVQFGTGSSPNQGAMNFNLVEFRAAEAPTPAIVSAVRNGANIEVSYTGVLEAATVLAPVPNWTPIATNSTGSTNVMSIPTSQSLQFFRSKRLPE